MKAVILLGIIAFSSAYVFGSQKLQETKDASLHEDIATATGLRYKRGLTGNDATGENVATGGKISVLSPVERIKVVDDHNKFRGQEVAADELRLKWDDELASLAQEWAEKCTWKHGMLTDYNGKAMGQNMFMAGGGTSMPDPNLPYYVQQWYDEKPFYDYDSKTCAAGKMCGHYTQVVWAKTDAIGCGYAFCPEAAMGDGIDPWNNTIIFVCNYSPAGNYNGQKIYEQGTPCSQCETVVGDNHGYKCEDNLCVPCIPRDDSGCSCGPNPPTCQNGGSYSDLDCVCICPRGYYGKTCEKSCDCTNLYGDTCLQWQSYCNDVSFDGFMRTNCPETCGYCNELPPECL